MNRWKCERCNQDDPCFFDCGDEDSQPDACPFHGHEAEWQPCEDWDWPEDNEQ